MFLNIQCVDDDQWLSVARVGITIASLFL